MRAFASWEVASKENKWQGRNITRWRNDRYDKAFREAEGETAESNLWADTSSERYWVRWNAAKMLEARGHGDKLDWTSLYIADLTGSDSCAIKKKAVQHLGMTHEVRALTAIQAAEEDPRAVRAPCHLKKTLESAEAALLAP